MRLTIRHPHWTLVVVAAAAVEAGPVVAAVAVVGPSLLPGSVVSAASLAASVDAVKSTTAAEANGYSDRVSAVLPPGLIEAHLRHLHALAGTAFRTLCPRSTFGSVWP